MQQGNTSSDQARHADSHTGDSDHDGSEAAAAELIELLGRDLDAPVETAWGKHALDRLARAELGVTGIPQWARAHAPLQAPDLGGLLTRAPTLAAAISWARFTPRSTLASYATAALVVHAHRYPALYASNDPNVREHEYHASLAVRKLVRHQVDEVRDDD